jgi:tRNA(Ser,Leu) C12 N-acetylase TAN1
MFSESDLRNKRTKLHVEEVQSLCSLAVTAKTMKWTRYWNEKETKKCVHFFMD